MAFTAILTSQFEVVEQAVAGVGGRTTTYRVNALRADNCDRRNTQIHRFSNDETLTSVVLSPLGATSQLASNLLLVLQSDQPIDLQLGASASMISGLRNLTAACTFSALLISTGSAGATVLTELVGGSAATIVATNPAA